MINQVFRFVGFAVLVYLVLAFGRFIGPAVRLCSTEGWGDDERILCPAGVEFRGDDIFSPLHVGLRVRGIDP